MRLLSLSFFLIVAAPAIAQENPAPQSAQLAKPTEKKICRRMDPPIGSIMNGKRICRTRAEWSAIDVQNQANADRALDRNRSTGLQRPELE